MELGTVGGTVGNNVVAVAGGAVGYEVVVEAVDQGIVGVVAVGGAAEVPAGLNPGITGALVAGTDGDCMAMPGIAAVTWFRCTGARDGCSP